MSESSSLSSRALVALVLGLLVGTDGVDGALATPDPKRWHPLPREVGGEADSTTVGFGVEAADTAEEAPLLVCRCRDGEFELFVIADTTVIGPWPSYGVDVVAGRRAVDPQTWVASIDGAGLFAPDPRMLAGDFLVVDDLELRVHGRTGRTVALRFDVSGFGDSYRAITAACPRGPRAAEAPVGEHPKFGEFVEVEELPRAISKAAPSYPDEARAKRMEGTVVVQSLVGKDGSILDTKVVKSVPLLDAAAVEAVRKWKFVPARSHGEPVEVWVAIPVKFSLN